MNDNKESGLKILFYIWSVFIFLIIVLFSFIVPIEGAETKAKRIRTEDDGGYYTGTNVEATLQEIANGAVNFTTTGRISTDEFRLTNPTVPVDASDTGIAGDFAWDSTYFYVCISVNTWKRVALETWTIIGDIYLEDGTNLLLEDGTNVLLEG